MGTSAAGTKARGVYAILRMAVMLSFFCYAVSHGQPIRGTWITNVASGVMRTEAGVRGALDNCSRLGFNTVFVVVWNKGMTMYPSAVAERYSGIRQDPVYEGFDPIECMVREAHLRGIRVYAWFEFGFSYAYGDSSSVWLQRYPHWAGRNVQGNLLKKNGFYWWNALHPEVQGMMTELVTEVVRNYSVDGVQGDDRLPAMPSEGGYDDFTKAEYAAAHGGAPPPADARDSGWMQWKADRLSAYGERLYRAVKGARRDCKVSWSPSIYPWSKENYLQDWPAWVKGGYADNILPQLYRYDIKAYEKILAELRGQLPARLRRRVFPGILTSLGNGYRVKEDMLREMIRLNRRYGFKGECWFYYETLPGLKQSMYAD